MKLRPYQQQAVDWIAKQQRGICQAPAGSGKTVIGSVAAKRVPHNNLAVIANTMDQLDQWKVALNREGITDVKLICGVSKACVQDYDLVIVDECHHAPAAQWRKKIGSTSGRIWGFSATPFCDDSERNTYMHELFGNNLHVVQREQLVQNGHLTPAVVKFLESHDQDAEQRIDERAKELVATRKRRYPWMFCAPEKRREQENRAIWQACTEIGICRNALRDCAIVRKATTESRKGQQVLILIATIEHGERIAGMIDGAELCHGKIGKRKRRDLIAGFRNEAFAVLVASTLADEGLDVPCASVLIVGNAGRSKTKIEQRTGRVLRPYPGKTTALIYDFRDSFHFMLRAQSRARERMYRKLGYTIS